MQPLLSWDSIVHPLPGLEEMLQRRCVVSHTQKHRCAHARALSHTHWCPHQNQTAVNTYPSLLSKRYSESQRTQSSFSPTHIIISICTLCHMSLDIATDMPFLLGTNIITCTCRSLDTGTCGQAQITKEARVGPKPEGSPTSMEPPFLSPHSIPSLELMNWLGPIQYREGGGPFPALAMTPTPEPSPSTLSRQRSSLCLKGGLRPNVRRLRRRHCVSLGEEWNFWPQASGSF